MVFGFGGGGGGGVGGSTAIMSPQLQAAEAEVRIVQMIHYYRLGFLTKFLLPPLLD